MDYSTHGIVQPIVWVEDPEINPVNPTEVGLSNTTLGSGTRTLIQTECAGNPTNPWMVPLG